MRLYRAVHGAHARRSGAPRHRIQSCAATLGAGTPGRRAGGRDGGCPPARFAVVRLERGTYAERRRAACSGPMASPTRRSTCPKLKTDRFLRRFLQWRAVAAVAFPPRPGRLPARGLRRLSHGQPAFRQGAGDRCWVRIYVIWVHDYHLFPLGEELRRLGVRNRIGSLLHTPFVPPALLHALPRAAELLLSMCSSMT